MKFFQIESSNFSKFRSKQKLGHSKLKLLKLNYKIEDIREAFSAFSDIKSFYGDMFIKEKNILIKKKFNSIIISSYLLKK